MTPARIGAARNIDNRIGDETCWRQQEGANPILIRIGEAHATYPKDPREPRNSESPALITCWRAKRQSGDGRTKVTLGAAIGFLGTRTRQVRPVTDSPPLKAKGPRQHYYMGSLWLSRYDQPIGHRDIVAESKRDHGDAR